MGDAYYQVFVATAPSNGPTDSEMKTSWIWIACCFFLLAEPCLAGDAGTLTLLSGKPKLLRGTTWFNVKEGARVRDGDVLDLPAGAQFELEFTDGGAVGVIGPGALYLISVTPRAGKQTALNEMMLTRGWLKLSTKPPGSRLRVRTGFGTVSASDSAAVVHAGGDTLELFVESGAARLVEPGKPDTSGADVKSGSYVARASGKPASSAQRAPAEFVSALPRDFMDPLPVRAAKYATPVEPVSDHESTFAEAQPWLSGPYRASFLKRFQAKLDDPTFKAAMLSSGKAYPEWTATPLPPAKVETAAAPPAAKAKEPERTFRWPWER